MQPSYITSVGSSGRMQCVKNGFSTNSFAIGTKGGSEGLRCSWKARAGFQLHGKQQSREALKVGRR
jgi:hypothetical protein